MIHNPAIEQNCQISLFKIYQISQNICFNSLFQITLKGNDTGSTLDITVEDPDLTEVIIFLSGIQRAKIYSVRIAACNVIGLGPYSEPFYFEVDSLHYDENEMAVGNSTRYTWLIALFGSLLFMLILVMSVLVYYRKRNMYHRKTMASHQVFEQ